MTSSERPNLTLGEAPKGLKKKTDRGLKLLLCLILAIQAGMTAFLFFARPGPSEPGQKNGDSALDAAEWKSVAMGLEKRSLDGEAARVWERHLAVSGEKSERNAILYRIGKLHMSAGEYEKAAAAFVRAELSPGDNTDLEAKIGPRMVECLRRLGLHGEVGRELSRRVEIGAEDTDRGKVLALLSGDELTEADLDRMIERKVDSFMSLQGMSGDEAGRKAMLENFETEEARKQFMQEQIRTELFVRRARELGLQREEDHISSLEMMEDNLLASAFVNRVLEKTAPTRADLEPFYNSSMEKYAEPERIEAALIALDEGENPASLLNRIESPDDFMKLASTREDNNGQKESTTWEIKKGRHHPKLGIKTEPLFSLQKGEWTTSPIQGLETRYLALVREKFPSRIPAFDEVDYRVRQDYIEQKNRELMEAAFNDLMIRYDVKILSSPGKGKSASTVPDDDHEDHGVENETKTNEKKGEASR